MKLLISFLINSLLFSFLLCASISPHAHTNPSQNNISLIASNDMSIQTGNLNILSSADTFTQNQDTKDLSGSVSVSMYGGGAGAGFSANYGESHSNQDYTYNTNSKLQANNINIHVENDALIQGANLNADNSLSMYVGNNLDLISVRDSYSSNSKGFNVGAGFSLGADKDYSGKTVAERNIKNQEWGARTGDGLGSANANFGINNSNYQQKETILSSITGNSVNIEVGGNTNLKGSLIAAGSIDENGNFIDNAQLSLTTGTLTYSSLSNSMYQSSNSFGGGTNVGFGELSQKDTQGKQTTTTTSKVNSSNINFGTDIGYSSEKVLATIGQGSLTIKDKENSDDTDKLNRDIDSQFNKLYEGSVGTSVEATVDHRFFSESGRQSIKDDAKLAQMMLDIIADTITKDSYSLFTDKEAGTTGYQDSVLKALGVMEASKKLVSEYSEAAQILLNPDANADEKQAALQALHNLIMIETGLEGAAVNVIVGALDKGFTSEQTGQVYISEDNHQTHGDLVRTDVHETSRAMDLQENAGVDMSDPTYKQNRKEYATSYGILGQDTLNYVLTSNGLPSLNSVNSNHVGSNLYKPNELTKNTVMASQEYQGLDLEQGGFRQLNPQEISIIDKQAATFAKQLYGDNPTNAQLLDAKARLAQEGLRMVDLTHSLILGGEDGKQYDEQARAFLQTSFPELFQVKDRKEYMDGSTNGQNNIYSMYPSEIQQITDFNNAYLTTQTSSGITPKDSTVSAYGARVTGIPQTLEQAMGALSYDPIGALGNTAAALSDFIDNTIWGAQRFIASYVDPEANQIMHGFYGGSSGFATYQLVNLENPLLFGTMFIPTTSATRAGSVTAKTGVGVVDDVGIAGMKVVDNAEVGIKWRGGNPQGMPFEDFVGKSLPADARLPQNFPTFDYYVSETQTAISVKTLDTTTAAKIANPNQIYYSVKKNIDSIIDFTGYGRDRLLTSEVIANKELRIAIPSGTTKAGMEQLLRAIDYGNINGIKVIATEVR